MDETKPMQTVIRLSGGTINYHLAEFLTQSSWTFTRHNTFLQENGAGQGGDIGNAQMFVIEGMDKVRSVIEKNWKEAVKT